MTVDPILQPLECITSLYEKAGCPTSDASEWGVQTFFEQIVAQPQLLAKIPYVSPSNVEQLPNNSLVRFRGLVQDLLNPEYYVGYYKREGKTKTTKYSDPFNIDIGPDAHSSIWERKPIVCTSVPGESRWLTQQQEVLPQVSEGTARTVKRARDTEMVDAESMNDTVLPQDTAAPMLEPTEASKLPKTIHTAASDVGGDQNSSRVVCEETRRDCLVFLYDHGAESVKLQDVVEVVGVVSKVPELASLQFVNDQDETACLMEDERPATLQPTSQVMRVHALLLRSSSACLPLSLTPVMPSEPARIEELRQTALNWLARALGGDKLAGEYLLLQLLSQVGRGAAAAAGGLLGATCLSALGVLPLALTKCPPDVDSAIPGSSGAASGLGGAATTTTTAAATATPCCSRFARCLQSAVSALVPVCVTLPLSAASLNSGPWCPVRDASSGSLAPGRLQLGSGTVLLLDETGTAMGGGLTQQGLNNLQELSTMVGQQQLTYHFPYFTTTVPCCVAPVALCSAASPTLLGQALTLQVPLRLVAEFDGDEAAWQQAESSTDGSWQEVRSYLAAARQLTFTIPEELSSQLQAHFVSQRQQQPDFSADDFHQQLLLAKLLAMSWGESCLTQKRWEAVVAMEHKRVSRIRVM